MSTLVVGCGFIGLEAARRLVARGERVFGTTRSAPRAAGLARLGIEPVVADVLDPASLRGLPEVPRVLHCVGYDRSSGPTKHAVYVDGLRHLLAAIDGRTDRFVYTSSTSVYGQSGGVWVDEGSPTEPHEPAGRTCLEAETLAQEFAARTDLVLSVVRYSGLYGPGRIIRRAALERGEPIAGDPEKFLNLIHRDDAVSAALAALDRGASGRVYLASDDRPVSRREYYTLAAACLGAPAPRFVTGDQRGHPAATEADKRVSNKRIKAELGLVLAYPDIATGLPAAVAAGRSQSPGAGSM